MKLQLFLLLAVLIFSCSKPEQREELVSFSTKKVSSQRCIDNACGKVEISYPLAADAESADLINEEIMRQLLVYFHPDKELDNLDSAANDFLDSYEEFKTEFPDAPGEWTVELEVKLTYESDSTLSFVFTEFNYSGGAHPNSSVYYLNFDKQTGKSLSREQVVLDQRKMLKLAEEAFREYHEVADGVKLEDDGRFFIPDTGFFLPNAIGYADGKLILSYIPYEIGPYVLGYTDLQFDLKNLEGVVRM